MPARKVALERKHRIHDPREEAVSDHYTYRAIWSPEDQEHAGLCAEFPSLSWLAASPDEALNGIRKLVGEVLEDMAAAGERPPAPFANRKYKCFAGREAGTALGGQV